MPDIPIDIPLPDNVKAFLARPKCVDIALPKPGKVSLTLPNGGQLKGLVDITKGIPDDCSLTFSLALQLGPFLASIECLMRVLQLIKPLIDVVEGLKGLPTDTGKLFAAIGEFVKVVPPVVECITSMTTPLGIIPFVRDILCLIIKVLKCITAQLKSIAGLMGGIALSIQSATAEGNTELLEQLKCAQENAANSAAHVMTAIEPVTLLLSLAEPFLGIAGVDPIKIPTFGSAEDVDSLNQVVATLEDLVKVLTLAADALGGC